MNLIFALCFIAILLTILPSAKAWALPFTQQSSLPSRHRIMLEASNTISVMLFSDNLESFEIGAKALKTIGTAINADFIELWRNRGESINGTCDQICWWEKKGEQTPTSATKILSYSGLFARWDDALHKGESVVVTAENASPALLNELAYHNVDSFIVIPVFFEGNMWGFLRLSLPEELQPLTKQEQKIMRSIGLILVASIQRSKTQEALLASEDRFRDVTLATGEIVWELDGNGLFSYISNRITEVTGYSTDSLMGKRWENISTAEYSDSITSHFFEAAITKTIFNNFDHSIVTSTGETLWFRSAAKLLVDSVGVAGLRGTSFNYTQTRDTAHALEETLQALQQSNLELEQAAKHAYSLAEKANSANTAKQNFLANISHEIRTPLNSIAGVLFLLEKTHPTPKQSAHLKQIQDASNSLLTIVDNILRFTNLQSGSIESVSETFSLEKLLYEIADTFQDRLKRKNLQSVFSIANNVPIELWGDMNGLRQTIVNLLDNAIKFTDKGSVAVHCSLATGTKFTDSSLLFTVSDTGIGMPEKQQQEMLEAFTQNDASSTRRFGGTGLGLSIAYHLVKINEGKFTVESHPGKGTSVRFTYPLTIPEGTLPLYPPKRFYDHIVIVAENPQDAPFLANATRSLGYTVDRLTVKELDALLHDTADNDTPIDIVCIPSAILQTYKTELEQAFANATKNIPMVVALSPTLQQGHHFPSFVTHSIVGSVFSFAQRTDFTTAKDDTTLLLPHHAGIEKQQLSELSNQLETIIALLEESDAEGRSRFTHIQGDLTTIDEQLTSHISNYLDMFQFAEAIPPLQKLAIKVKNYGD